MNPSLSPGHSFKVDRVLAIGGGHGLSATLGAARLYGRHVTALVSLADDGGSSGILRSTLGMAPPGDLRKCLVALASNNLALAKSMEFRFDDGHALGNLILTALSSNLGGLVDALDELVQVFGISGRILPVTQDMVTLVGQYSNPETGQVQLLRGQAKISSLGNVRDVFLEPRGVGISPEVQDAIARADQILIGPGSLYTSILAALAPAGMSRALAEAKAKKIYISNLREQIPETAGYSVADHLEALGRHGIEVDVVAFDPTTISLGSPVRVKVLQGPLSRDSWVHDPELLAEAICNIL